MLFSTLVLQRYYKNGPKKKEDYKFLRKKERKIQNSVTIIISADGKRTVFPLNC